VDLNGFLRRHLSEAVPLSKLQWVDETPDSWSSEQLERLVTPREIELVRLGRS